MRHAHRGKLCADTWVLLVVVLVFYLAFLASSSLAARSHKQYPPDVQQKAQFNSLNAAIELFNNEFDGYPPSDANDPIGQPYCGSMKLTEALMGRDLLGFHTKSIFRRDGLDAEGTLLYPANIDDLPVALREAVCEPERGLLYRRRMPMSARLVDIYGKGKTGPFPEDTFVLCDIYQQRRPSGEKTGMPILYYRADSSGTDARCRES